MFSALGSPNYRLFWIGRLFADMGLWMQMVAQGWLVYQLTDSPLYLGLTGLARAVPAIGLSLFGGVLADRMEKRRLIMLTQTASLFLAVVLATLVATDLVQVWHVMAIAFLSSAVSSFDQPTRQAIMAELVDRKDLLNAVALNSAMHNGTRIIGPSLGGLIIVGWSLAACFYINAAFIGVTVATLGLLKLPGAVRGAASVSLWQALAAGFGYVRQDPVVLSLLGLVAVPSFFGMSYVWLLPVFARDILQVGATGLGLLQGVSAAGALVSSLGIAAISHRGGKGRIVLGGSLVFGLALVAFASSTVFALSLALIFLLGVVNSAYLAAANTLLQTVVPDDMRGRVMGFYTLSAFGLSPLGSMAVGALASGLGTPIAVAVSGGVVAAFALVVLATVPQVRRLA